MTNDMTLSTTDEKFPDSVTDFIKEYDKRHLGNVTVGTHNIYHVQSIDMDGNVTQEAFALNVFTDYGMRSIYWFSGMQGSHDNSAYPQYMYIGNGSEIDKGSQTLTSPLPTSQSNQATLHDEEYGLIYDKETRLLISRKKGVSATYNYNYGNMTQDYDITEIGLGKASNQILFHSLIYDVDGNVSKIQKRMNEQLTITTYHTCCMRTDIFDRLWDKGIYAIFDPVKYFNLQYIYNNGRGIGGWLLASGIPFNGGNSYSDYWNTSSPNFQIPLYGRTAGNVGQTNQDGTFKLLIPEFKGTRLITDKRSYIAQILLSDINMYSSSSNRGFSQEPWLLVRSYIYLSEPEEISYNLLRTNSWTDPNLWTQFGFFTNLYGNNSYGGIPVLDFDMKKLTMYNYQTKKWDIEESFQNNPEKLLYEQKKWLGPACRMYIYIKELDKTQTVFIFMNSFTDRPITSFGGSGIVLYMTDQWWDTSTWVQITNLSQVPVELQCKRYIITTTNLDSGSFNNNTTLEQFHYCSNHMYGKEKYPTINRKDEYHKILYTDDRSPKSYAYPTKSNINIPGYNDFKCVASDSVGYVVIGEMLIYPDSIDESTNRPKIYEIKSYKGYRLHNSIGVYNPGRKNILITFPYTDYRYGFRIITVSEDPEVAPISLDIAYGTTLHDSNLHISESDNGYLCISDMTNKKLVIIDITGMLNGGTEPTVTIIENILVAHAIGCTNYCCCRVPADEDGLVKFQIIDMRNPNGIITDLTEPDPNIGIFKLPEGHTYQGICGWSNFIYISTNNAGVNWTILYYMQEKKISQLSWTYAALMEHRSIDSYGQYIHIERCVDDCMVLCGNGGGYYSNEKENYRHLLFRASDPENPYRVMVDAVAQNECAGNVYCNSAQLTYLDESKQQLMLIVNANRCCVYDIGRIIDEGVPQTYVFNRLYPYRNGCHAGVIFRKNVVYRDFVDNSKDVLYIEPIEQFIDHHVEGTTWTINSFNNPVQVTSGVKNFQLEISNVLSNYGEEYNPTPST